jgi:outer membrane beta-barrel protein
MPMQPHKTIYQIFAHATVLVALLLPMAGFAQNPQRGEMEQVIQPEIDRREVRIPHINVDDFEIGAYLGLLSVEDFGAKPVYGARLVYHVSEDYFVEAMLARSTVSDQALCDLGLCLFPNREEDLTYYGLSVGYNLFPAEIFFGQRTAMASTVYLLGGVGNTGFIDENHLTINFGLGLRILPTDGVAVHITFRDHLFESDILGTKEIKNNFEFSVGLSAYF